MGGRKGDSQCGGFEMLIITIDILASPHPLSLPVQCVGCPGTEPFSPTNPVGTTLQGRQGTVGCNHGNTLNFIVSVFCAGVVCLSKTGRG